MEQVSETAQVQEEGVKASTPQEQPQEVNDWKTMAQTAQSGNDKYVSLESKYGSNFEEKLEGFSEFEKQWLDNPKGTIENLQKQAGINVNEPQPQTPTGEMNIWELGTEKILRHKRRFCCMLICDPPKKLTGPRFPWVL